MKHYNCYKCLNLCSSSLCKVCDGEKFYISKVTGKPSVKYENLKVEDSIMPMSIDKFGNIVFSFTHSECDDCIKKDVCVKHTLGNYHTISNCAFKISTKNIVTLMDEKKTKEASAHLSKLCEELLALKRRLDNGERSLDLYIEIMNHEFVDPAKMVEENDDGTK